MVINALLTGWARRKRRKAGARALYQALMRQTRQPGFYSAIKVPDSFDGRFDLLVLHAFLLFRRMRGEGAEAARLAQAVFDTMFADMDGVLREQGVDQTLNKKLGKMAEAFYGRSRAYEEALAGDDEALAAALIRNVWRGESRPEGAKALSAYMRAADKALAAAPLAEITQARLPFPSIPRPGEAP